MFRIINIGFIINKSFFFTRAICKPNNLMYNDIIIIERGTTNEKN
jgi:hypothetical protein